MEPAFTPSHITPFGFFHTIISIIPVITGLWCYVKYGRIDLMTGLGRVFMVTALIGTVTGLFIVHHGGFGVGHVLSAAMLALLLGANFAKYMRFIPLTTQHLQDICFGFAYFLLWFFTTTETLTRFPAGHPFADSPAAPDLAPLRGILVLILIVGLVIQWRRIPS